MSLEDIQARNAADHAAGIVRETPAETMAAAAGRPVKRFGLTQCAHFGGYLQGEPCGSPLAKCDLYGDTTSRFFPCEAAQRCCDGCKSKTQDHRVAKLQRIARNPPKYPGGKGQCVLTVGGGKYWPGVVVMALMLRSTGSTLPIQCWYRGSVEAVNPQQAEELGIELLDVDAMPDWVSRPPIGDQAGMIGNANIDKDGWRVKLFAIARTRYETVLYLDADAYPVVDPEQFIKYAKNCGFVFWEDISDGANFWPAIWPSGPAATRPVQGGQLVINRRLVWEEVCLASAMNEDASHYYEHLHGDQDTWRVALAITGFQPICLGKAPWRDVGFVCEWPAGTPLIVHRVRCKLFRPADINNGPGEAHGKPHYHLPREAEVFSYFARALAAEGVTPEEVFGWTYAKGLWGEGSGAGSGEEADAYVEWVNTAAQQNGWRSCVDAGCGDGRVAARLDIAEYTGVDCVPGLRLANMIRRADGVWITGDITDVDSLPAADVLLCKDVLHHWPSDTITKWLDEVLASRKWQTVVLCVDNDQKEDGADCPIGSYRALSPKMYPLNQFPCREVLRFLHKSILVIDL